MRFSQKYIAIDIETTDTDERLGDIIQLGAVVLNEDLSMGNQFLLNIKPLTSHRNKKAMEVNKFTEELLARGDDAHDALYQFEQYALENSKQKEPMLAAWANYFDIVFLREFYRKLHRPFPFSYKSLDLKSIAIWEAARRDEDSSGGVDSFLKRAGMTFEGTRHNGLYDIVNSTRILQRYEERG